MTAAARSATGAGPTPLTRRRKRTPLLPYQTRWLADEAPRKLGDKSRRTGWTYIEAFDAVSRRFRQTRAVDRDYWFSSADESAGVEFIDYCRFWARDLFGKIADQFTDGIEDPATKRMATALCIRTPGGRKIVAMSSNPRRFRSKGGDVCLDEFAFHDDARAMYTAAAPVTTWGGTLRVFSTPNGEACEFHRLVQRQRKLLTAMGRDPNQPQRDLAWEDLLAAGRRLKIAPVFSYHRVTLADAIAQGLVEAINRTAGTSWTREAFLADCREKCLDEESFRQEYMCEPGTDQVAWLSYQLIERCEADECPRRNEPLRGYAGGPCVVGVDVGRTRDLTVIWVAEEVGDVLWTRRVVEMQSTPLPEQQTVLEGVLREIQTSSCVIDKTGLGLGLYEYARARLGGVIEGVEFSNATKQALAVDIKARFEDRAVRIPADDPVLRDDLHRVRKVETAAGLVRFDAARSDQGHADRFWALALACHAARGAGGGYLWVL